MSVDSVEKEIVHWNILTLTNLLPLLELTHLHQQKEQPKQEQLRLRDFYFNPVSADPRSDYPSGLITESAKLLGKAAGFNK